MGPLGITCIHTQSLLVGCTQASLLLCLRCTYKGMHAHLELEKGSAIMPVIPDLAWRQNDTCSARICQF